MDSRGKLVNSVTGIFGNFWLAGGIFQFQNGNSRIPMALAVVMLWTLVSGHAVMVALASGETRPLNGGTTGSASDQQSTNDWKVAGSRPTKVVCISVDR